MSISRSIDQLINYALACGLIEKEDVLYARNSVLQVLGMDEYKEMEEGETLEEKSLQAVLDDLTDYAIETGVLGSDDSVSRDLFDTKVMGVLVDRPSNIASKFWKLFKEDKVKATDWFYKFSQDTNYIRRERIVKDRKWTTDSKYGLIDITINLSKPEKDPKAIAAAKLVKQSSYPKCMLCLENEGYAGRMNHPARQNHRIIPIEICGNQWGFQYSPYVYYNEHCIVFNGQHTPMKIDRAAFEKLFSFVEQFPHYFLGSNADLPIVGGSILTHDHFQGGHYTFAMEKAEFEKTFVIPGFEDIKAGIVHWPLSVIRIQGKDPKRLIDLAEHILNAWRGYTDEAAFIFAETEGEPHNTITPIARRKGDLFEMDLTLRNNITTEECPLGVYHPHKEYHNIKKENIGLIEVMGLAVLPARLDKEMALLEECLVEGKPLSTYEELAKHEEWVAGWKTEDQVFTAENVRGIVEQEIGKVFVGVLEDAGVYKCTEEGREAFDRFVNTL